MRTTIYEKITPTLESRGLDVVVFGGENHLKIRGQSGLIKRNVHHRGFRTMRELVKYLNETVLIEIDNRYF
jgi:hypothetical protein